jgi:hypothetical protein
MSTRDTRVKELADKGVPWAVIAYRRAQERADAGLLKNSKCDVDVVYGEKAASEGEIKERVKALQDSLRVVKRKDV